MDHFLFWRILFICSYFATYHSFVSSLHGGYVSWKPGNEPYEILIDYTVFFDLESDEGRRCTQQAIDNKTLLHSNTANLNKWIAKDFNKMMKPKQIDDSALKFYCKHRSKDMNRVVGEFRGLRFKSEDAYYYIGFDTCCLDQNIKNRMFGDLKFGTLVDLTPRIDLSGRVNHSPEPVVLPYYKVMGDDRIRINAVDNDNDFLDCKFVGDSMKFNNDAFNLQDCVLAVQTSTRSGKYIIAIAVEDYRNREVSTKEHRFSSVTVVFELEVIEALIQKQPRFSPLRGLSCNNLKVDQTWENDLVVMQEDEDEKVIGVDIYKSSSITVSISSSSVNDGDDNENSVVYKITVSPTKEDIGKHLICFVAVNIQRVYSKQRCWYLQVGSDDATSATLETEFIYPQSGGLVPPNLSVFEIKVLGAFNRPFVQSYLKVYRHHDNQLQYQIDLADPKITSYVITRENHILIKSNHFKTLQAGKQYYVQIQDFAQPQHACMKPPALKSRDWNFTVSNAPEAIKFQLKCYHDRMTLYMNPRFHPVNKNITKVAVGVGSKQCKMTYIEARNLYYIDTSYQNCGTQSHSTEEHILFTNVAEIRAVPVTKDNDPLISRDTVTTINLQCQMKRSYLNSIKGKVMASDYEIGTSGTVKELDDIEVEETASEDASFPITFQVYRSARYIESYGTEEFPIIVSKKNNMYFELALKNHEQLRLVPRECYATRTQNPDDEVRHYIIKDSCQADVTYSQYKYDNQTFRFSIEAFTFKDDDQNSMYVHCHTYVCHNTTSDNGKCQFGCQRRETPRRRGRRGLEENVVEEIVTSTFEIKIRSSHHQDRSSVVVHRSQPSTAIGNNKSTEKNTYLYFIQIPIAILVIVLIFFLLKKILKERRNASSAKSIKIDDDEKTFL